MTQLSPFRRQVVYTLLLLCTVAPVLFLLQTDRSVSVFDGNMVPLLSYRVLLGQVPHRDFYNCYGPLPFLLQAACYKLFGVSLWVAYLLNTAGRTLTLAVAYLVVRRVGTQAMAVAVAVAFYLLLSPSSVPSVATAASRFLILGAALSATAFLRARRPLDGLLVGLVAGLITLYRYEQGVVVLLVEAVTVGAASLVWTDPRRSRLRAAAASMGAALCGYALLAGAMVLVFARLHALGDLLQQMNFLRLHNPAGRRLPFTLPLLHHPEQNLILLPLLAAPLGLAVVTVWLAR